MPLGFVTGATGFVGRHLIDVLKEDGWDIIAGVRDIAHAEKLLGNDVKFALMRLRDPSTIASAIPNDVDCVFHVAADTSTWSKEAEQQYLANVDGTSALLQVVLDKQVKRMVHVSSIVAYGEHKETITDDTPRLGATSWVGYIHTKSYAERKVKEAVDRGLDAVIVNPTDIVGRYDNQNWIRMIKMIEDGTLPAVPPGNGNFANGRAVAEGILAAYKKGKTGQNYILGGPYSSFHEFLSMAAEKLGKPAPPKPKSALMLKTAASILGLVSKVTGRRPQITPEEAYFACQSYTVNYDKAIKELGYRDVPLSQSMDEAIAYMREQQS
ncbi:NAD-dependent epimerase/dehydratase family protein [Kordiimonas aquimaris]|uniref:NAD-dependent epimerase/dehydratase family protein n=1 Tax=Kordiimonas aquimaris TaxID=707591 RepID=UPI0021CF2EF1|nr:NAD-dependent epimerase/dehydratase family protein [Kordiimonas aquimaris]